MNWYQIQLLHGEHWGCYLVDAPDNDTAWADAKALRRDLGALAVTVRRAP